MVQLYYAPDNASLIVRMLLEELQVDYQAILVDRSSDEQHSKAYRQLNPNGLIPVCVIDGKPVFETAAIVLSLAERHRELAPAINDDERVQFLKWLFFLSNSVHTDLRQLFYPSQYAGDQLAAQQAHRDLAQARLLHGFSVLEEHCAAQEGPFMMDEELTVLDLYLAVLLRWSQLYPKSEPCVAGLAEYPALQQLCAAVELQHGVQRACEKEGIDLPFFDRPSYAQPKEGSAT